MSMNGGVAASRQSAAGWLFRRTAALCRDAATGDGSWAAFILFCACIGTMNQIGTPLPALSPQGGERVAGRPGEGRFTESFHDLTIAHPNDEPTPSPALRAPSPPRRGRGRGEGAVHGQGW